MRDKVKRFISILMTALMLVNLLPVGALAEGFTISNSVQGIRQEPETGTYNIYVYVMIKGENSNFVENKSGWFTLGKISNVENMPNPKKLSIGVQNKEVSHSATALINGGNFSHDHNTGVPIGEVNWYRGHEECGFVVADGADDYPEAKGKTWHLNGYIDASKVSVAYTIKYIDANTNQEIAAPVVKYGKPGEYVGVNKNEDVDPKKIEGYNLKNYDRNREKLLIGYSPVFYVRYTKSNEKVPVRYEYQIGEDVTEITTQNVGIFTGDRLSNVSVPNEILEGYKIEGWYKVNDSGETSLNEKNATLTAKKAKTNLDFSNNGYYTLYQATTFRAKLVPKADLSYTVNYIDKDTGKAIINAKTVDKQEFGAVIESEKEKIEIDGYNYDSVDKNTLTIGTGENAITFYYTKRTDLSYTVNYIDKDTGKAIINAKTVDKQTFGTEITSASEKIDISGYNYDSASPETLTIQADESKNVINLYYTKKTDLSYTVNYYWNGTNPLIPIKNSESGTETYGKTVNPDTDVPGYTLVPGQTTSLEIKDDPDQPNVLNLYYYKNVKLKANDTSRVYNGAKQTILSSEEYTVITTLDNQVVETTFDKEINVTGSGTDVGSNYTMYFPKKEIGIHNEQYYVVGYENGKLSITKRPVTLTSGSAERVYNGEALTKNEVTASTGENEGFVKGQGATYDVTGSQTDVGESKNTFTYKLNGNTNANNYSIELVLGKLEVTPVTAEVIVTITGRTDEMPYDGKEHSVFGYDVTVSNTLYNPKKDMQFNGIDEDMTAKGIDAGTYPMELTAEYFTNKSKNFSKVTFVVTDGYVKITPRAVTLTSASASKVYDGTALTKPVVTVGGDGFVEGQVTEIKATGSMTNAGSVANTITFTPNKETFKDGNYAITKTEGTLTIAKRSVLITSQSATKTYDGSALTRPAVTITGDGFVPGELAKAEATGSITKVGSTPNAIRYTTTGAFNAANYSIALSVGTLTVTEKPKPEPRRTFNLTINYVYQNGKRAAASYNRGGLKNGETFDITSPVIAGYTASETVVSGTIYNRDIKVTVIYTADGVNLDDYGVPLGLGNITMNVGDCFE